MAARNQQGDKRKRRRHIGNQRRQHVAFQVVYTHRRDIEREGQGPGHPCAHQQCAGKARALRIGDAIHVSQCAPTLLENLTCQRQQTLNVIPRRQFRHDAAVFAMHRDLRIQRIRQQTALAVIQRNTGFITGGLDAKHQHSEGLPRGTGKILAGLLLFSFFQFTGSFSGSHSQKMPHVKVKENEPFDVALRRFKRSIEKVGLLTELRAREFYEKPTAERKRKLAAAVKRQSKRLRGQQLPPKMY